MKNNTGHHITKCIKCGKVISQCRCTDDNKPIFYDTCEECLKLKKEDKK